MQEKCRQNAGKMQAKCRQDADQLRSIVFLLGYGCLWVQAGFASRAKGLPCC
ncbi:MAG: hypothetical protein AB9879_11590 [Methanothrix sp.]